MSDTTQGEAGQPPAPTVDGITEQDYAMWRHHPVTRMFLKYLRDRRADFLGGVMDRWLAGALVLADEKEILGFAKCLDEVHGMPFSSIAGFYEEQKAQEALQQEAGTDERYRDDDEAA